MSGAQTITIPSTSTSTSSKPYTIYHISIRQPLRSFSIQKRYSDFVELHGSLSAQFPSRPPPAPLPAKSWFKSTTSSPELAEERRKGLETYLQAIQTHHDPRWRETETVARFLNLTPSAQGKTASSQAAQHAIRNTDLSNQIVDPAVWLDVHRDLKHQLGLARQALRRRTEAKTIQQQLEAASDTKRELVRCGASVLALEVGLRALSAQTDVKPKQQGGRKNDEDEGLVRLGEGEITRRRGLLSAAIKERDSLESQLGEIAPRLGKQEGSAEAGVDAKQSLLQNAHAAHVSSSSTSRRVLGKLPETAQTRELDNEGVLQLQKQLIQDQDQDVEVLTTAVRRMKEMGMQIGDELEYQNKMLGMLDEDVTRVQGKVDVANKRIGKIR